MWQLVESIKRSNREFEAIGNNETYGRIVVEEDETVVLCVVDSNEVILTITDEHKIDVMNGDERHPVTRKEILTTKERHNEEMYLFAGLQAFVK